MKRLQEVRIALLMRGDGQWHAQGWSSEERPSGCLPEARENVGDFLEPVAGLNEAHYVISAFVPVPDLEEISGIAEETHVP